MKKSENIFNLIQGESRPTAHQSRRFWVRQITDTGKTMRMVMSKDFFREHYLMNTTDFGDRIMTERYSYVPARVLLKLTNQVASNGMIIASADYDLVLMPEAPYIKIVGFDGFGEFEGRAKETMIHHQCRSGIAPVSIEVLGAPPCQIEGHGLIW